MVRAAACCCRVRTSLRRIPSLGPAARLTAPRYVVIVVNSVWVLPALCLHGCTVQWSRASQIRRRWNYLFSRRFCVDAGVSSNDVSVSRVWRDPLFSLYGNKTYSVVSVCCLSLHSPLAGATNLSSFGQQTPRPPPPLLPMSMTLLHLRRQGEGGDAGQGERVAGEGGDFAGWRQEDFARLVRGFREEKAWWVGCLGLVKNEKRCCGAHDILPTC